MQRKTVVTGVLGLCLAVSALRAQTPGEVFQSTFGDEAAKVAKTPTKQDDVEFAAKLLEAAKGITDEPQLQVLLCRKACEFAMTHPSGCPTAKQAVRLRAKLDPNQAPQSRHKMVDLSEALHRRTKGADKKTAGSFLVEALVHSGDATLRAGKTQDALRLYQKADRIAKATRCGWELEVAWKVKEATYHQRVDRKLAGLQKALNTNPQNPKAAKELVILHLVDKDQPAKAMKLLEAHHLNGEFKARLELACTDPALLSDQQCLELSDWYKGLAGEAKGWAKVYMLKRAKRYGLRFLEMHKAKDVQRVKAAEALDKICEDLAQACAKVNDGWLDLLALADPARDVWPKRWLWKATEAGLASHQAVWIGIVMVPYEPPREYDLVASFTREIDVRGGGVALACRFGEKDFRCTFGGCGNTKSGLEPMSGGLRISHQGNTTVRPISLTNHRRYAAQIRVRAKGIGVWLDGKPVLELLTDGSALMESSFVVYASRCLGLVTNSNRTVFHSFRVKEVSGKGRFLKRKAPQK